MGRNIPPDTRLAEDPPRQIGVRLAAGKREILMLDTGASIRGKWLAQVVAGYFAYHAVPTNGLALAAFRYHVAILWHRQLCRRSQRARLVWTQMAKLVDEFLPSRRSFIRGPACGSPLDTQGRSRMREFRSYELSGGRSETVSLPGTPTTHARSRNLLPRPTLARWGAARRATRPRMPPYLSRPQR